MTKKLYESQFHQIIHHTTKGYLEDFWTSNTGMMTVEEYKHEMIQYRDMVVKLNIDKALISLTNFLFPIAPSIQQWADQNIMEVTSKYIKKAAFVLPSELVAKLSVEQINQGEATPQEVVQYFDNVQEALDWLLS